MKNFKFISALGIAAAMTLAGCYYDKYEVLYPPAAGCDTTGTVTYNNHVKQVFATYCTSCHSIAGGKPGGYDYESYASSVTAAPRLIGAIKHLPNHTPMPNPTTFIDDCSIAKIEKWVNTGTQQ